MPTHKPAKKDSPTSGTMSSGTKDLMRKFCYKKTASIDMTKNGFIYDSKLFALTLLLRLLRKKCEKIWGTKTDVVVCNKKKNSTRKPCRRNQQDLDKKIPRTKNVKEIKKESRPRPSRKK